MSDFVLTCGSTADLTAQHFKERDIHYVCYHFFLDGVEYPDDLGQSMSSEDFYKAMVDGAETKTAQVNVDQFVEFFTPFLADGKDILHLSLSGGITGSGNSARIARDMLLEKFPDRKLYIIDSLAASSGYGLLMDKVADLRDSGMSIDELYNWVEENKLKLHHWFFSSDLTFFIKGGRVSKAAGVFGSVLNICPILNVSPDGRLISRDKVRGKQRAITGVVDRMKKYATDRENYSGKVYICHSARYDDAKAVADLVKQYFPKMNGDVQIYNIGTTIGAHTGPGTVALFFWGDERTDAQK